jgi:hypothetical protein
MVVGKIGDGYVRESEWLHGGERLIVLRRGVDSVEERG